jgi:hypothetical protein
MAAHTCVAVLPVTLGRLVVPRRAQTRLARMVVLVASMELLTRARVYLVILELLASLRRVPPLLARMVVLVLSIAVPSHARVHLVIPG